MYRGHWPRSTWLIPGLFKFRTPHEQGTSKCLVVKEIEQTYTVVDPMATARLFRVILPVSSIEEAAVFYSAVLEQPGMRISPGRHYFGCGGVILTCFDPRADGDAWDAKPNPDHVYFAVGEWSFYCTDPFGNKLCFVDESTLFTGGLI